MSLVTCRDFRTRPWIQHFFVFRPPRAKVGKYSVVTQPVPHRGASMDYQATRLTERSYLRQPARPSFGPFTPVRRSIRLPCDSRPMPRVPTGILLHQGQWPFHLAVANWLLLTPGCLAPGPHAGTLRCDVDSWNPFHLNAATHWLCGWTSIAAGVYGE